MTRTRRPRQRCIETRHCFTLRRDTVRFDTLLIRVSAALLAFAAITWLLSRSIHPIPLTDVEIAGQIERYTWNRLAAPYPTGVCETARHLAYARELGAGIADLWYVSSQMMANVALARVSEGDTRRLDCTIERAFDYLELLWQDEPISGYAPRSDLDGSNVNTLDIYADDNAIAGVAMLAAAEYVRDPELQDRMLRGATRAARYLMDSGLWDDTYEGGFWWNTQRELSEGGKPVQTADWQRSFLPGFIASPTTTSIAAGPIARWTGVIDLCSIQ